MKNKILFCFFIAVIINILPAQELQLSLGPEFAFGTYKVNNDIAFNVGNDAYLLNETTDSVFFAPGINFSMRVFMDTVNPVSQGFFFRDRAIFVTNMLQAGTATIKDRTENIREKYSPSNMDFFIGIMDFDTGWSTRYKISEKIQFYADLGINFTIMDYENYDTRATLNYWGAGIYAALAWQVNLPKSMYLEFGLNSIINVLSSQKGVEYFFIPLNYYKEIKYEDSGRWDLTSTSVHISIGWRIDLKEYGNKMLKVEEVKKAEVKADTGTEAEAKTESVE
jgi:hypothetical protein